MLVVRCDQIGRRVLLSEWDVTHTENVGGAVRLFYRCWCGAPGALTSGRRCTESSGHLVA